MPRTTNSALQGPSNKSQEHRRLTFLHVLQEAVPEFAARTQRYYSTVMSRPEAHTGGFSRTPVVRAKNDPTAPRAIPYGVYEWTKRCMPDPVANIVIDGSGESTIAFESLRGVIKAWCFEAGEPRKVEEFAPQGLVTFVYNAVKGRHTELPEANGKRPATDDIDMEWTTHIVSHVLLYRMWVGIGTNHESDVYLGREPEKGTAAHAYRQFILDAFEGDAPNRNALDPEVLSRFTGETEIEFEMRQPYVLMTQPARRATDQELIESIFEGFRENSQSTLAFPAPAQVEPLFDAKTGARLAAPSGIDF